MKDKFIELEIECPRCEQTITVPENLRCPKCDAPPRIIRPLFRVAYDARLKEIEAAAKDQNREEYPNKSIKVPGAFHAQLKRIAAIRRDEINKARKKGDTRRASANRFIYEILLEAMALWLDENPQYR